MYYVLCVGCLLVHVIMYLFVLFNLCMSGCLRVHQHVRLQAIWARRLYLTVDQSQQLMQPDPLEPTTGGGLETSVGQNTEERRRAPCYLAIFASCLHPCYLTVLVYQHYVGWKTTRK